MKLLPKIFVKLLTRWATKITLKRRPDFVINPQGDSPYLLRWWVIPRNRLFNIYLHLILRDDNDVPHDHPWYSASLILKGGYNEVSLDRESYLVMNYRAPGHLVFRKAKTAHRLTLPRAAQDGLLRPALSLFFTGPRIRTWGFHCPNKWIPWHDFVNKHTPGQIGAGCHD